MKLAQIMAGSAGGGAEAFFERLSLALHRQGEEVLPVIRRNPERAARLADGGLEPRELRFGGRLDLVTRPRLAVALRRFEPTVAIAWMNRAARLTPRGDWVLAGRLGGFYDPAYYRRCDHLIANTLGIADWLVAAGVPSERVHHLPNFVPDLAGAAPAALPTPAGSRVALALGRLHRNKGFDLLIRALPRLPGLHLAIAGEGPERTALAALARSEGVAARVHWLGWRSDTAALLAAADLLVCPSRHEPLGNVVLEAFAARRPVVAAAVAGPCELIASGREGLLVPPEDPEALARAIATVLADADLATALAAAGRARFEADHAEAPVLAAWRGFLDRASRLGPIGRVRPRRDAAGPVSRKTTAGQVPGVTTEPRGRAAAMNAELMGNRP